MLTKTSCLCAPLNIQQYAMGYVKIAVQVTEM